MHVLLFLSALDSALGRFNQEAIDALSDQQILELMADTLTDASKRYLIDRDGEFMSVLFWPGVRYRIVNGEKEVTYLYIDESYEGLLSLQYVPRKVYDLRVRSPRVEGQLDTSALPQYLIILEIIGTKFSGTVDFEALPANLKTVRLSANDFSGKVDLSCLPKNLTHLNLSMNSFSGCVSLRYLPENIESIHLSKNKFLGELSCEDLPRKLHSLDISQNAFCGEFRCTNPPKTLKRLDASQNTYSGTAMVHKSLARRCKLSDNEVTDVLNSSGYPFQGAQRMLQRGYVV